MKQKFIYLRDIFKGHSSLWLGLVIASGFTGLDGIISPAVMGILTNILTKRQFNRVWLVIALFFVAMTFTNIAFWFWQYFNLKIIQVANTKLRADAYDKFITASDNRDESKVISFIDVDVKQIENQFINAVVMVIYCFEQALITLIYILYINSWVALVYLVCGFLPTVVPRLTKKWLEKGTKKWSAKYKKYNLEVSEGVKGFHLINNYGVTAKMQKLITHSLKQEENAYFKMNLHQETSRLLSNTTYVISTIIALLVSVLFIMNGQITVGAFISLYLAADRVTSPILSSVQFLNQINSSTPLLEAEIDKSKQQQINNLTYQNLSKDLLLEFDHASFGYDHALIKDINFAVKGNSHVMIEGPSGVEKSTIFKTLLNEIPLFSGEILVNSKLNDNELKHQTGIISQDTFIFSKSLRFNLTLGEDFSDEDMIAILRKVELDKFASTEGLDTRLGENGVHLSGGEKRKIELARALLRKKTILLLDEALSGLDHQSMQTIFQLIVDFKGTVIDIEHNLSDEYKQKYGQILELTN